MKWQKETDIPYSARCNGMFFLYLLAMHKAKNFITHVRMQRPLMQMIPFLYKTVQITQWKRTELKYGFCMVTPYLIA